VSGNPSIHESPRPGATTVWQGTGKPHWWSRPFSPAVMLVTKSASTAAALGFSLKLGFAGSPRRLKPDNFYNTTAGLEGLLHPLDLESLDAKPQSPQGLEGLLHPLDLESLAVKTGKSQDTAVPIPTL
jgi:hypothetical protein